MCKLSVPSKIPFEKHGKVHNASGIGVPKFNPPQITKRLNHERSLKGKPQRPRDLVTRVRQEGHESGSFNSLRYRMLADRTASAFTATYNTAMPVRQFGKQIKILVVDMERMRSLPIDKNRIFFGGLWFLLKE